ncbi:MAG: hypothetical protein CL843_19420 [Crocinitomicaceae bacterium]|nr:hypothetical protein [Crocinitomicaceae bacterium]|tara:strand:- start:14673 stop:15167 length:495 start_codon:yes stop_codon:yes gene_type:complete
MKSLKFLFSFAFLILLLNSCEKDDDEIDQEKPKINLEIDGAFPVNCDTLYFGETFTFKVLFSDNAELGSYSIDVHHNFDHHTHTTEVNECDLEEIKDPVNPYVSIVDYDIPEGKTSYETSLEITIPSGDENGEFDRGDYHFFISLTDKEGWSTQKGLSIKMMDR